MADIVEEGLWEQRARPKRTVEVLRVGRRMVMLRRCDGPQEGDEFMLSRSEFETNYRLLAEATAAEQLKEKIAEYRAFRKRGGTRGSNADRTRRREISELMIQVRDAAFRAERIEMDEETANELDPFAT